MRWHWWWLGIGWGGCVPEAPSAHTSVPPRCPEPDPADDPLADDGPIPRSPARGLWGWQRPAAGTEADDELRALANLGYVDGSEVPGHPGGVAVNCPEAQDGFAFYTSGHGPLALLMDLSGEELHRWSKPFSELWPERVVDERRSEHQYWRRATLRPDGDVLAIVEGQGLVRLDWDSQVVWKWGGGAHHDLEVLPDERVWVLSRRARIRKELGPKPILEDYVTLLGRQGCPELQISLIDAVLASSARDALWPDDPHGDVFHTNSLRVLDEAAAATHPAFEPGFLLLSMRTPSGLLVLDPETAEVVWWWQGPFREQHDPEITAEGLLLLFDNIGLGDRHSSVRAFRLSDGAEMWRLDEVGGARLDSRYLGAVQRLDDGHLLVTESTQGHAFEVDGEGRVVWSFRNPERAGIGEEFVAVLPEMLRVEPDYLRSLAP